MTISGRPRLNINVFAEEGSGKVATILCVGDKGRAQLVRAEPALFKMAIQDTYKNRVTFSQVRKEGAHCSVGVIPWWKDTSRAWHLHGQSMHADSRTPGCS